ncbi:OmpA family protein [Shewanella mangrovisoli]|uniref:OmpA family protein n=1 Tax=Shewanella mangrovisoli TaxID=2864211 RepID=UPI0035B94103
MKSMPLLPLVLLVSLCLSACIQTPEPFEVKQQTRDLYDADLDGVINARDDCAATPVGAIISNEGCPKANGQLTKVSREIMFEFDNAELTADQQSRLLNMVDKFKTFNDAKVILIGDTSPEGSDEYNHKLAQRRVAEITRILVEQGIPESNITKQVYFKSNAIPEEFKARKHRIIAVAQWKNSGTEISWNIFSSETN